jgi:hypothetical protein
MVHVGPLYERADGSGPRVLAYLGAGSPVADTPRTSPDSGAHARMHLTSLVPAVRPFGHKFISSNPWLNGGVVRMTCARVPCANVLPWGEGGWMWR